MVEDVAGQAQVVEALRRQHHAHIVAAVKQRHRAKPELQARRVLQAAFAVEAQATLQAMCTDSGCYFRDSVTSEDSLPAARNKNPGDTRQAKPSGPSAEQQDELRRTDRLATWSASNTAMSSLPGMGMPCSRKNNFIAQLQMGTQVSRDPVH